MRKLTAVAGALLALICLQTAWAHECEGGHGHHGHWRSHHPPPHHPPFATIVGINGDQLALERDGWSKTVATGPQTVVELNGQPQLAVGQRVMVHDERQLDGRYLARDIVVLPTAPGMPPGPGMEALE